MEQPQKTYKNLMWRTILTVLIAAAAVIISLIYVAFYAAELSVFQKSVVVIAVLVVSGTIISILWISWRGAYKDKDWKKFRA